MNTIFSINNINKIHYLSTKTTITSTYKDLLYKFSHSMKIDNNPSSPNLILIPHPRSEFCI